MTGAKIDYPATQRNRQPIADALARILVPGFEVLEVASGTGQHVAYFAERFPDVRFQPADREQPFRQSIAAWVADAGVRNVQPAIHLDTTDGPFPVVDESVDVVVCSNMIHIAPFAACEGLVAGAARALRGGGWLVIYGPFKMNGQHTAPSNTAFDADLRGRNPAWGIRDLEQVVSLAEVAGLQLDNRVEMPANNQLVMFRK